MCIIKIINTLIIGRLISSLVHLIFCVRLLKPILLHSENQNKFYTMKKTLFIITIATVLSSCCTIFTASKQNVTFRAPNGTKIYDVETNVKIAEVEKDNMVTPKIKKKISDKQKENKKQYSEYFGEVTQTAQLMAK